MLPVFLDVRGRRCVVVGGGKVGGRRISRLLKEGAKVLVISRRFSRRIRRSSGRDALRIIRKEYEYGDVPSDVFLVFECVGDKRVARALAKEARDRGALFNSASFPELSDFLMSASLKAGGLEIAISSYGRSPSVVRVLRKKIEEMLPVDLGRKIRYMEKVRAFLRSHRVHNRKRVLRSISKILFERSELRFEEFRILVLRILGKWGCQL